MIDSPIPETREEAKLLGAVAYFTGDECQNGHIDKRYMNTGICYACKRSNNKRNIASNPEISKQIRQRTYIKNRKKCNDRSTQWHKNNIEKSRKIKRRNKTKYKEKYRESSRIREKEKCDTNPEYRLYKRMSKSVWHFLKLNDKSKEGDKWISLVNYNVSELICYLETQFDSAMTWDNYGQYWHVDHIVPRQFFIDHCLTDKDYLFKCCWSLENLRPLKAEDNSSKGDSVDSKESQALIDKFDL